MNLLLLSSSRVGDTGYLEHAENLIKNHLGDKTKNLLFIPYAGVSIDYDTYEEMVSTAFEKFGYQITSIHHSSDPQQAILNASAIAVGGGNTFNLLATLYENQLLDTIREKVQTGTPYIGWSAGSNIAAPSIRTTNDMPIVEPASFDSLHLLPIQINPHYIDGNPPGHNGETREQRINEFLVKNPRQTVIGIPEGTALKYNSGKLIYVADKQGFKFTLDGGKEVIQPAADLSSLI